MSSNRCSQPLAVVMITFDRPQSLPHSAPPAVAQLHLVRPQNAPPDHVRFCTSPRALAPLFSLVERCSLDSRTGFEVFVPGRQSMASAMDPVFRSANLIRRTVSHL